jgi:hypothetical protein
MFFLLNTSIFLLSCRLFYLFLFTVGDRVRTAPSPNASLMFFPVPLSLPMESYFEDDEAVTSVTFTAIT